MTRPGEYALGKYSTPWGFMTRRELRILLAEAQNWRCCYCGVEMTDPPPGRVMKREVIAPTALTIEHLQHRTHGGQDSWANAVAACHNCNSKRPLEMTALEFYECRQILLERLRQERNRKKRAKWRANKKRRKRRGLVRQLQLVGHDHQPAAEA